MGEFLIRSHPPNKSSSSRTLIVKNDERFHRQFSLPGEVH